MQAVPEPMPMQQLPNFHLRRGIAASYTSHHARPDFFAHYVHENVPNKPDSCGRNAFQIEWKAPRASTDCRSLCWPGGAE